MVLDLILVLSLAHLLHPKFPKKIQLFRQSSKQLRWLVLRLTRGYVHPLHGGKSKYQRQTHSLRQSSKQSWPTRLVNPPSRLLQRQHVRYALTISFLTYLAEGPLQKPIWGDLVSLGAIDAIPELVDVPDILDDDELPPLVDSEDSDGDTDEVVEISEPRHGNWPVETHLVYPAPGAKIALGPQNLQIQRVARASIQGLMHSIYWDDAFPDHGKKTIVTRDALYNAAKSLGFTTIAQCVKSDADYVEALADLVGSRVFKFQTLRDCFNSSALPPHQPCSSRDQESCSSWCQGALRTKFLSNSSGHHKCGCKRHLYLSSKFSSSSLFLLSQSHLPNHLTWLHGIDRQNRK